MIEMTWIPEFIRGAVWIYIAAWVGFTLVAFVLPKTTSRRVSALLVVTVLFGALPTYLALSVKKHNDEQRPIVEQRNAQLKAAMARFDERCKTAGEKIYRTVEDVEGIVWMKWRSANSASDQFNLNDPYGHNCSGDSCISALLVDERMTEIEPGRWQPKHTRLYEYVDSTEPGSSGYSRYSKTAFDAELKKSATAARSARYGVTWEDISTPEDRQLWIAGGKMQLLDLQTNQILAERIGYLVDKGQGNTSGFRSPWADAFTKDSACPSVRDHNVSFITRVLKPKKQGG